MRRVWLIGDKRRAERQADYRELTGFEVLVSGADADVLDVAGGELRLLEAVAAALAEGKTVVVHAPPVAWSQELLSLYREHGERLRLARPARWDRRIEALRAELDAGEMGATAAVRVIRLASTETSLAEPEWWTLDALLVLGGAAERVFCRRSDLRGETDDQALSVVRFESGAIGYAEASNAYPAAATRTVVELTGQSGMLEHDSLAAPNRIFGERLEVLEEEYVVPPRQRMLAGVLAEPDPDSGTLLALAAAAHRATGGAVAVEL